jgi:hypothetical protein
MSDSEKIRSFLNASGYPFQQYCAARIAKMDGLQIAAEVPITYPATVGATLGVHTAIDLLAARLVHGAWLTFFVIECKKANDKIKNWVLLCNQQQTPRWPTFMLSQPSEQAPLSLGVTRSITFPTLGYPHSFDYDFSVNAIEVNTALSSMNREQAEKVYNSLKQVMHGTVAFEQSYPKVIEGIDFLKETQSYHCLYIPVVITTANIYTPTIQVDDIVDGEIPIDSFVLGETRKWASFEFALPDYLSYEAGRQGGKIYLPKRTVFIVNSEHIDAFFAGASNPRTILEVPPV